MRPFLGNIASWRLGFWTSGLLGLAWVALFYPWFRDEPAEKAGVAINAAIGAVYYIRVLLAVYSGAAERDAPKTDIASAVVVAICAALTLGLFFFPSIVMRVLQHLY